MRWVLSTYNLTDFSSFDVSDGSEPPLELMTSQKRTQYPKCYTDTHACPMGYLYSSDCIIALRDQPLLYCQFHLDCLP